MTEKIEKDVKFPLNQELLAEASKIKEEWNLVKDRLAKIEEHKDRVSKIVHDKVSRDYTEKLKEVTSRLAEKQHEVENEISMLLAAKDKLDQQLKEHQHNLEELNFRNSLGEFSPADFQEKSRGEKAKIGKFDTLLKSINSNIDRYREIFPESLGIAEEAAIKGEEITIKKEIEGETGEIEAPVEQAEEPQAEVEEEYPMIEEGESYFEEAEEAEPKKEGSLTSKTPISTTYSPSRIVIINGDEAGAAYPIKGMVTFGRARSNTVFLRDVKISRQHAQIEERAGQYVLTDLNSSNGTFVNGERIKEHVLSNNDEIQMGDVVMQYQEEKK